MTEPSLVVYALDVGVYSLGSQGQVLSSSTSTGWCRLDALPSSLRSNAEYQSNGTRGVFKVQGASCDCGKDIEDLACCMLQDLKDGNSVALGFEAPMWIPIEFEQTKSWKLFRPRFDQEKGHGWYLQGGAAATLKAIGLGFLLFNALRRKDVTDFCLSTSPELNNTGAEVKLITVYEAFVTGDYKIALPPSSSENVSDMWDAYIAAAAWFWIHVQQMENWRSSTLHGAGSCKKRGQQVISIWEVIANAMTPKIEIKGCPDCEVVGVCHKDVKA
jgi:hypothetical protein